MVDRLLLWLGAGAVCAGVTVAMLAGAGTAHAQTDSGGGDAAKSSQSAKPAESKPDSARSDAAEHPWHRRGPAVEPGGQPGGRLGREPSGKIADRADGTGADDAASDPHTRTDTDAVRPTGRRLARTEVVKRGVDVINEAIAAAAPKPDRTVLVRRTHQPDAVDKPEPGDAVETAETTSAVVAPDPAPPVAERIVRAATHLPTRPTIPLAAPTQEQPRAAATRPIDVPPAISAVGTLAFGLISLAESVFEGPPMALPGSGVTVTRSTLVIGDQEVPADWYFPDGTLDGSGAAPEHIIYLQHGFLATGVFYDYTASYLAQQTNSVVVAPTLTSNIFATDGMWLGGTQMHEAVADLFLNGNTALQQSAEDAGYPAGVALPSDVVLVGHSLGGGLVLDTARYIAADADPRDDYYQLAGVLMLDGVAFTDPVPILRDIPDGIPVYNLSSTPYMWNLFGSMDHALAEVRGDQFHGAQLLGGLHSDSMIGGNALVQFGAYLLTGFSSPSNVAGSQILAATWINDMFACQDNPECTRTPGFYGLPGDTLTIPTAFGPAVGLVQPEPGPVDTLARELTAAVIGLLANVNFATDVPAAQETAVSA